MRKIILFYLLFFLTYSYVSALPLLGVIPFVFEIGILIYATAGIFFSGVLVYLLKYQKIYAIILLLVSIVLIFTLYLWVGEVQWKLINLQTPLGIIDYEYALYIIIIFSLFSLFLLMYCKKYILLTLVSGFSLLIHIPLVISVNELDMTLTKIVNEFNKEVNNTITNISPKILNNIFVSQDFRYKVGGEIHLCRITISYYEGSGRSQSYARTGNKNDSLQLYTGLDTGKCREYMDPIFKRYR